MLISPPTSVPVERKIYAGLPHAFHLFPDLKATTEFYDTIIEWITRRV